MGGARDRVFVDALARYKVAGDKIESWIIRRSGGHNALAIEGGEDGEVRVEVSHLRLVLEHGEVGGGGEELCRHRSQAFHHAGYPLARDRGAVG